jgi:hypothetical protein
LERLAGRLDQLERRPAPDVNAIAAAVAAALPPITFHTIDDRGKVLDTESVSLGGTLKLNHELIVNEN